MTLPTYLASAGGWPARVNEMSGARCDLDVLLRDEWRHRIVPRDDRSTWIVRRQRIDLTDAEYAAVKDRLCDDGASLGSLALAALHTVLDAYGHGTQTVVAYLDAVAAGSPSGSGILPVIVDQVEQSALSCGDAVKRLERALGDRGSFSNPEELLHRGLFDSALVRSDADLDPADLPPIPLVAVVHDDKAAGRLAWTLVYAAELFDDTVIAGVLDVLREVFLQYVTCPELPVRDIELLPADQKRQLLLWNSTQGAFPEDKRLNELFEDCVRRSPDHEAVVFRDARMTYKELDERSNQLAHWLLGPAVRVRPRDLVALCLDKSDLGVIATFGIWKAGAAYVPIDPSYPTDRIRFTIGDTAPSAIITNRRHAARLRELLAERTDGDEWYGAVTLIEIEPVLSAGGQISQMPRSKPDVGATSTDLAYVTYTSGTTGMPKGVPKEHRSVVNSITDLSQRYDMCNPDTERVALYASYVFEPHLRQTLIALINSQTLVIVPDDVRLDPDLFPAYLARHEVTYLNATGSVLQHFDLRRCPGLKRLLLVGEELTSAGLRRMRERFEGHIVNEYAFTESAFVTAVKEFPPGVTERTDRSIGRPLRNVTWYVLSQNLKLLPVGAIGELYIGGCGVAPGYLHQDELTAGAFFANPFQSEQDRTREHNARIYKTGDLARMLPGGEVEYLGRSDFQLKINGVRLEPGEIEARATEYPGVRKCVVVARETAGGTGDRHLVGYYVAEAGAAITEPDLLAYLEEHLIQVMVPARMIRLDSFPVNVNGKVDWRALPEIGPLGAGPPAPSDAGRAEDADSILTELRTICSAVLGFPAAHISAGDDFFRLGGQSISCILLIARIRRQLRRNIGVEDVFRLRTLAAIAGHLAVQDKALDTAQDNRQGAPDTNEAPAGGGPRRLLANGLQQGLLYHSMKSPDGDDAYVVQSVYRYHSRIRADLMEQAWRHAQRRYPSLRLRFEPGVESFQVIEDDVPLDWRFVDLRNHADRATQEARIAALQEEDRAERYRPADGGLFRVYLIRQAAELFTVVFSCHHIVIDGWSLPVLHDEVHRVYLDLAAGKDIEAREDQAYIAAQRYWQDHRNDHVDYWTRLIDRIDERGDLSGLLNEGSRYKVALRDYDHVREHKTKQLRLGVELTGRLVAACLANEVTLHSVLQFVWHKALYAIGGGCLTVTGTIVSGRNMPVDGIESSVGLFINTLPLVVDHTDQSSRSVAEAVAEIQSAVHAMNDKSIVELGRLQSGAMKRQLFDTLLVLENYPRLLDQAEERRHQKLLRFEKFFDADRVDHPMAAVAREEGDELTLSLWFAGELFSDTGIDTLLETTRAIFEQVAADMARTVGDLEFLSPAMAEGLAAWNRTEGDFPAGKTLHAVFEEAAATWPDAQAVVYNDTILTYRELNERANQLAHHLLSLAPLRADDLIALVVDKSELMIVAIVAAWKTGAAYVPIDPDYPDDRIAYMLEDTECRFVLANQRYANRLRGLTAEAGRLVLALEELDLHGAPKDNPVTMTTSTDLAYAIYTSGTTGRPKAVLVEHRGVVNLQTSMARLFELDKRKTDESVLSFSNYVFDHFIEQMTDALLNGQKMVVLDDRMRTDEARLCRYINDNQVTYLSGTPSVLSLYDFSTTTTLRRIDAIGEDFTEPVFDKIRSTFPGVVVNGYGPTEISITSHKRPYAPGERRTNKSIGFPVANTACYVLNSAMKRVPVGGIGELYIGGIGVARGYLNRPDLTAERFLDNPFRTPQEECGGRNARMYKTGDLARWLPNGELEYLGRTDLQVKIRGQRVELGEIEAVLGSCPGVTRALVIAREHAATTAVAKQKYLVGFYIGDPGLAEQDALRWMRGKLAESLIPARVLRIDDIPVTPSGKLDVKRLPQTEFAAADSVPYVAPASDIEIRVCQIWAEVLGTAPDLISAHDDFFALGGDSIRAMALAQAMTSAFGRDLGVTAVFQNATLAAQALHIQDSAAERDADGSVTGIAAARAGAIPVSLAQERLLFIDEFEGGTSAYNIPFCLRLCGASQDATSTALRTLVGRHAALRTLLRADADGLRRQHILSAEDAWARFTIDVQAVRSVAELDEALLEREEHVFRLGEELPIQAGLLSAAAVPGEIFVSLVFHHTCFDGWSWNVFRREMSSLLDGVSEDRLPAVRGTYADFAVWQRQHLSGRQLSVLVDYWTRNLRGFEAVRLPLDLPRPARFDYQGREAPFSLDRQTTEELRALARSARVSLYSVLLAAWCLMLRGFTGQEDIVVGTPFANRGRPEFDGLVGFLANLLAVRVRVDQAATLTGYVHSVGAAVVAAQVHAELPFEQLVKELEVAKDASRHPVVQANFTLLKDAEPADIPAVPEYQPSRAGLTSVKFDLSVILHDTPDGVTGTVTYAASLFEEASVQSFLATFHHILAQFARLAPDAGRTRVADIAWVDEGGRPTQESAAAGQATGQAADAARARSLHELFEQAAAKRPDEVAVACDGSRLTYRDLNEQSNRLARRLRSMIPLRADDMVALVLDKSELMIVALLAVWKAGAAYVPIDPGYPDDRIAFMLEDTRARLVLASEVHANRIRRLANGTPPVLDPERLAPEEQPSENLALPSTAANLAYAIYTSGTTGRPKAVLVRHGNAVSFQRSLQGRYFDPDGQTRNGVLFLSNYVFDFSVEQLALSILSGHKLIIPPPMPDPGFHEFADREGLTFLSGTPTQIQQLDLSKLTGLRYVLVAGETFSRHHFDKIRREFAGPVFNAYGTTETTVYNTVRCFQPREEYRNDLGKPLGNTRLYILDDTLKPLPSGAAGELYIAGECVSGGYLNRPELSAERFIANHLRTGAEKLDGRLSVLYKTGDVVRLRSGGELQYLGRNDAQVKIRGLRIELGEVEAAIAAFADVRECAVVVHDDELAPGSKRLIGYYVPEDGTDLDDDEILTALRAKLAPGMVPSLLIRLDHPLPMTVNGKLDTEALPRVEFATRATAYAAPRSRVEARMCRLWSELLPVDGVGIDGDFFRSGGDSISALHLASRVQRETGCAVSVKDVFDHPTVRAFVGNVLSRPENAAHGQLHQEPDVAEEATLSGECPMLPIQRWFFAKPLADRSRWNQNFAIRTPLLDEARLRSALDRLVEHHDAFRLRYRAADSDAESVGQFYAADRAPVVLHTLNVAGLRDDEISDRLAHWQSGFDLEHGPLFCVACLDGFADGSARVWFAMHHLIVDVVSWRILAQDLEILYHGGTLGPKGSTYRQWVRAARRYMPGDGEEQLWAQVAADVTAGVSGGMPTHLADAPTRREEFILSAAQTEALLTESNWAYDTDISDLLLTAVGHALGAITGWTRNHVTVEAHGRELFDGAPDVRDTVGWFTTMHPVAVEADPDPRRAILATKANRRRAPYHGIGYGLLRGTYGSASAPLPPVSFNYLGRFTSDPGGSDPGRSTGWRLDNAWVGGALVGGEGVHDSALDVTMSCIDGHLVATVDSRWDEKVTQLFASELAARLSELIAHTSAVVRDGAARVAGGQAAHDAKSAFVPFIPVGEGAVGRILFVLPPGEGGAESYLNNIARQLSGHRLVLFNNLHLHTPGESIEALAEYYLDQIRRIQPRGPYSLLGWSFGGVLSVELARQLAVAGERIDHLLLIDPYFNVLHALERAGLPGVEDLLDPINYRYAPSRADLDRLSAAIGDLVLFKACEPNEITTGEDQRRLFESYLASDFNYLDTLLPGASIRLEPLPGRTHHNWVEDQPLIAAMGRIIAGFLADPQPLHSSTPE
jgi:N-(5-amino-5-carboxypentanoyl)-L-cysteinyl-D-valine synthase